MISKPTFYTSARAQCWSCHVSYQCLFPLEKHAPFVWEILKLITQLSLPKLVLVSCIDAFLIIWICGIPDMTGFMLAINLLQSCFFVQVGTNYSGMVQSQIQYRWSLTIFLLEILNHYHFFLFFCHCREHWPIYFWGAPIWWQMLEEWHHWCVVHSIIYSFLFSVRKFNLQLNCVIFLLIVDWCAASICSICSGICSCYYSCSYRFTLLYSCIPKRLIYWILLKEYLF